VSTERSTIIVEMLLNEEKTERYLYKRIWSRAKAPKLACVMTIHPGSNDPNRMDLTTMLTANSIYEMGYDGFLSVNLTGKIQQKRKISASDFSEENESAILEAFNDEQVEKIIVAVGSTIKTNKDVNSKLKSIIAKLPEERREMVEVLVGINGPVHPLTPVARGVGGWKLAKLKM
jgi:hypothetical protein